MWSGCKLQEFHYFRLNTIFATAAAFVARAAVFRRVTEKVRHRHSERVCDQLETARSNPVPAFFILLHLLKCDPDSFPKRLLCHLHPDPPDSNSLADKNIYLVRSLFFESI
ncbi:hypothetical protein SAMN05216228_11091 [Rhizobium tibeticum]|uniref:Uncharacterized protein n=1 Tax=Rhizobium tibeticum TaxID=501024 RepID=A0ABY1AZ05_9HYPH|nr:hypothetical protein SAMN05216228_11091 [Rhizobium tibeticum]